MTKGYLYVRPEQWTGSSHQAFTSRCLCFTGILTVCHRLTTDPQMPMVLGKNCEVSLDCYQKEKIKKTVRKNILFFLK